MYYTIAKNQEGKEFVLHSTETNKIHAQQDIVDQANFKGLKVNMDKVYKPSNHKKNPSTITKFFKERKKTGSNGNSFDKFL